MTQKSSEKTWGSRENVLQWCISVCALVIKLFTCQNIKLESFFVKVVKSLLGTLAFHI